MENFLNFFKNQCKLFLSSLSVEIVAIVVIQPLLIVFITYAIPDSIILISILLAVALSIPVYLAKNALHSYLLHYWIVLSVSYTIIVFEILVVPMAEITFTENLFLVLFSIASLWFLYLTVLYSKKSAQLSCGLQNGFNSNSICPACRIVMDSKNYHCNICQECIPKYDHHSYWLNCCIGENNIHFYIAGLFFGVFALFYAFLLITTTICTPEFKFGILLPEDCTDMCENIETCSCLVSGLYCMELSVILLCRVLFHFWLIGRDASMFEWTENFGCGSSQAGPRRRRFLRNWIEFLKKYKKITA